MPSPLSVDLRERVVSAVAAVASCHQAAARFGVRIEAQADLILTIYEARPAIFLRELRDALTERGLQTSTSSLSRFFARRGITRKKRRSTPPSRRART